MDIEPIVLGIVLLILAMVVLGWLVPAGTSILTVGGIFYGVLVGLLGFSGAGLLIAGIQG